MTTTAEQSAPEPHETFQIKATCVTCGWEDWGWEGPVYESMREHTREAGHRDDDS